MSKHRITYACGHETTICLTGNRYDRAREVRRLEQRLCSECWKKEQSAADALANQKSGLPELEGSEKQIAWAESLRAKIMPRLDISWARQIEFFEAVRSNPEKKTLMDRNAMSEGFENYDDLVGKWTEVYESVRQGKSAKWWIDNRDELFSDPLKLTIKMARNRLAAMALENTDLAAAAKAEATLRPQNPVTETVAEITIRDLEVDVLFPEKRLDFWEIVKKDLGYTWKDGRWSRTLGLEHNSLADMAAELGNKLLCSGFIVCCFDEEIQKMIVDATFVASCTKIVAKLTSGPYAGWFSISWKRSDGDLYQAAREITGSKYSKPNVVVPAEQFEQILDFAELYGFKMSPGARELVEKATAARDAALIVNPVRADRKKRANTSRPSLDPGDAGQIDTDLLDHD